MLELRFNRVMACAAAMAILSAGAGCRPASESAATRPVAIKPSAPPSTQPLNPNAPGVLVARLKVMVVEVPVGMSSASEDIWSCLDEEPIAGAVGVVLGRNGFRMGLAQPDAWNDIVRVLKEMTGRETQAQVVSARIGDPVPVVLKSGQPVQTIFAVREDRSVSGADYPAGDNCLALLCSLDADNPDRIILTGVPQIRGMERKTAYGRQGEEFILRTQEELYNFDAMMFRVSLPVHGILVIGPGGEARRESSVGHHFLVERKGGVEYEIVLVLMADVSRLPAKRPQ